MKGSGEMKKFKCGSCGHTYKVEDERKSAFCPYCGAENTAEETVSTMPKPKRNKTVWIISAAAAAVAAVSIAAVLLLPNALEYSRAKKLAEDGNIVEAAKVFLQLGDYRDSHDRALDVWDGYAQRKTIAAGPLHSAGLKNDGTVTAKSIGFYEYYGFEEPDEVDDWTNIIAVEAGSDFTLGLKDNGRVVVAGYVDVEDCTVAEWSDIVAICANDVEAFGLKADGTVVKSKVSPEYSLVVNDTYTGWTDIVAIDAFLSDLVGVRPDGTVVKTAEFGEDLSSWSDIVSVAVGAWHTVGLKSDGTVVSALDTYVPADDNMGQADVDSWTDIVEIDAANYHTIGLKSDGTVVAAGSNEFGQCNVSGWTDIVAIDTNDRHTIGLKSDGTVVVAGESDLECTQLSDWSGIKLPERKGTVADDSL